MLKIKIGVDAILARQHQRFLQLGYTLPENLVNRLKVVNRMRIYLTGQNMLTFTKYTGLDPETVGSGFFARGVDDGSFPNLRTFTGGIEISF